MGGEGAELRPRRGMVHYVAPGVPCAENAIADEQLLRRGAAAIRVAVLSDRAVSVGVGVPDWAPFLHRVRAEGIPVVRRSSGGTAVLHGPGDIAWSVVLPRDHPAVGRDYVRAYDRLGAGIVRFLGDHGLRAEWSAPPAVSEEYCLLGGRGLVLTVDGGILGGAAQHVDRATLLHHGILPARVDPAEIGRLFHLRTEGTTTRLTSLREVGLRDDGGTVAPEIAAALRDELDRFGRS